MTGTHNDSDNGSHDSYRKQKLRHALNPFRSTMPRTMCSAASEEAVARTTCVKLTISAVCSGSKHTKTPKYASIWNFQSSHIESCLLNSSGLSINLVPSRLYSTRASSQLLVFLAAPHPLRHHRDQTTQNALLPCGDSLLLNKH